MGRFADLCVKYGCDKERSHSYGDAYDILLRPFEQLYPLKILEIGILGGASLRVMQEFVPHAKIWAIDIDPTAVAIAPAGVSAIIGDQSDENLLRSLVQDAGHFFDVVIDDGSHRIDHQRKSFEVMWPYVSVGGIYVIEDLETSKAPRPRKWNPMGMEPMLDMLLNMARNNVHWRGHGEKPPMITFFRELCCLTKME